jgi:hypothetical protein
MLEKSIPSANAESHNVRIALGYAASRPASLPDGGRGVDIVDETVDFDRNLFPQPPSRVDYHLDQTQWYYLRHLSGHDPSISSGTHRPICFSFDLANYILLHSIHGRLKLRNFLPSVTSKMTNLY